MSRPASDQPAIRRGTAVRRVPQAAVVREWLREEPRDGPPVESLSDRAALDELLDHNPGSAAFVWRDAPVTWYALRPDRETFERLRVVEGPDDLRWRALSPDDTILGAARRIAREDPDELAAETGVDVRKVLRFRADPPDGPLVLSTRRGCGPIAVADGNHRAVALGLGLLTGEPYHPPRAYLGVGSNPVLRPFGQRLCGVVRRAAKKWAKER